MSYICIYVYNMCIYIYIYIHQMGHPELARERDETGRLDAQRSPRTEGFLPSYIYK